MALLTRLNIPILLLLGMMIALLIKSWLAAIAIFILLLFYLATLPAPSTRYIGLMFPVAFIFSIGLGLLDHEVENLNALFTKGNLMACLMYTIGAFMVLAPIRLLKIDPAARYALILVLSLCSALILAKAGSNPAQPVFLSVFYFLFLSGINGTVDIVKLIRAAR